MLHIFRTLFPKKASGPLLLNNWKADKIWWEQYDKNKSCSFFQLTLWLVYFLNSLFKSLYTLRRGCVHVHAFECCEGKIWYLWKIPFSVNQKYENHDSKFWWNYIIQCKTHFWIKYQKLQRIKFSIKDFFSKCEQI